MLRNAPAAVLLTAVFATATATAQTGTTADPQRGGANAPAATSTQPGSTATQPPAGTSAAATANVRYITENRRDLWRASQLEGVNIYNEQNENIGDVSEVLLNRQGQVEAVVIGVGGFLGIGERDVAVPFDALQWQMTAGNEAAPGMTDRTTTTGAATTRADGTAAADRTTGTATNRMNQNTADVRRDAPMRAVLAGASRSQLENAPEFRYAQ